MGVYVYGMSKKTIPSPLGPVNTSYFIGKIGTYPGGNSLSLQARRLMGRTLNNFSRPPEHYVTGNPKDFRNDAERTGKSIPMGVFKNDGHIVWWDTKSPGELVGWFIVRPTGKIDFQEGTEKPKINYDQEVGSLS